MWLCLLRILWVIINHSDSDGHTWGALIINNNSGDVYT